MARRGDVAALPAHLAIHACLDFCGSGGETVSGRPDVTVAALSNRRDAFQTARETTLTTKPATSKTLKREYLSAAWDSIRCLSVRPESFIDD